MRWFRTDCPYGRFGHRRRFFGALRQGYFRGLGLRTAKMLSAEDLQLNGGSSLAEGSDTLFWGTALPLQPKCCVRRRPRDTYRL